MAVALLEGVDEPGARWRRAPVRPCGLDHDDAHLRAIGCRHLNPMRGRRRGASGDVALDEVPLLGLVKRGTDEGVHAPHRRRLVVLVDLRHRLRQFAIGEGGAIAWTSQSLRRFG